MTISNAEALEKVEAFQRTIRAWFKGTHYVNVLLRRNARDEIHEADFLNYVPDAIDKLLGRAAPTGESGEIARP